MLPIALAAALAPQVYKGVAGIAQHVLGDNLERKDYTPPAFYEALGLGRQAATAALPGEAQQLNRIEAGTNDTLAAAQRAGTSGSSILDLLGKTDANRTHALADLAARSDADHQAKTRQLGGLLQQKAGYEAQNEQRYEAAKGALTESSQRNLFGALDGASQVAAYGFGRAANPTADVTADGTGAGLSPAGPDALPIDPATGLPTRRGGRYNQYGIYDPTGGFSAAGGY